MSEEQIKIWQKVEAKGLEKLEKIQKAIGTKEGFKEAPLAQLVRAPGS